MIREHTSKTAKVEVNLEELRARVSVLGTETEISVAGSQMTQAASEILSLGRELIQSSVNTERNRV